MTYGNYLEQRRFGVYYYRQTVEVDGRQVVKRVSLRTKDTKAAKFIALQMRARTAMVDLSKIKKYELQYDDQHNVKSVKVTDDADARNLQAFMQLQELHKAAQHKRELELLKVKDQQEEKAKTAFAESADGQALADLHERLQRNLAPKAPAGARLEDLRTSYLEQLKVGAGTRYRYANFISKLISYAASVQVDTLDGVDRKFVWGFVLFMRNKEAKEDKTIKNIFNTLSGFYNHLLMTGETKEPNPFVGHKLDSEEEKRNPFTAVELEKIFSSPDVKANQKLWFILLLLATTGARPNEICQLWTDDIAEDGDFYTIRITENKDRDQSLKTKASKRVIYLNSLLVKAGFIEYLKTRKLGMVFDLKRPAAKTYSTFISEDLTKILRALGIADKTMYFFRHTANTRMKHGKVPQDVREDMVGHEGKGTNELVYSQKYPPATLRADTEEILSYRDIKAIQAIGNTA